MSDPRELMPDAAELAAIRDEAVDLAGIGLYRFLLDGTLLYMNEVTVRFLELEGDHPDPSALAGRDVSTLFEYLEEPGSFREAVREHGVVRNREYHLRTLRGNDRWFLHTSYLVAHEESGQQAVQAIAIDITDQKLTEQALRHSESKTRAILRAMPDLMFRLADDGTFLEFYAVRPQDLYVPPEQIVGKNIRDLVPAVADRTMAAAREAIASGQPQMFEYSLDMPDGERHFEARHVPFAEDEVLSIVRDVTEQVETRRQQGELDARVQLSQRLESLGVLAGGIAHDFNNLLTGILGNAGMAIRELDSDHTVQRRLADIERGAQRAADLTSELLAYSGKAAFVVEPMDLSALVAELVQLLHSNISDRARLQLDLPQDLPAIEGDATQIRQVVMNLITNASESLGDDEGVIRLQTGAVMADDAMLSRCTLNPGLPAGEYVYVEVTDTGCGMDDETRARIFEPFFTTKFSGRGLGLAAVLGIVRSHGGTLEIESEPGRGSRFCVLWPVSDRPVTASEDDLFFDESAGDATILVVDDQESVLQAVASILESAGHRVLNAGSGHEAVEIFQRRGHEVDLVLLDMAMPLMDGEETFHVLRALRSDVRVLLTSGYLEQDALTRFGSAGPVGFVPKPYQPSRLMQEVARALADGED
jgi:two-component system, cell cycle sensor histidine kinase and response regulator CckA